MKTKKRYDLKNTKRGVEKTNGRIELLNSSDGAAEIYIYGDIVDDELTAYWYGGTCPQDIADFMAQLGNDQPVTIYINSGGGDVFAGLAIYNILHRHGGKTTGVVDGMAASIASVILMACDERKISTGAQIMVHDPWTYASGNAAQLRDTAKLLDTAAESILDVYETAAAEGVTRNDLAEIMHAETWMRGEEAAEYFNVITAEAPTVAAAASDLINSYKNLPDQFKADKKREDENKKRADSLLKDLYLFGT